MDNRVRLEKKFLKELSKSVTPNLSVLRKPEIHYCATRVSIRKYSRLLEKNLHDAQVVIFDVPIRPIHV